MGQTFAISAAFLKPGSVGGAEHMLRNLVRGLAEAAQVGDRLLVLGACGWPEFAGTASLHWLAQSGHRNRFVEEWRSLRRHLRRLDAALLPNYFTPPVRTAKARIVTVIHDLQYLHFPENFSRRKRLWLRAAHELTLRRADAVVVISEFVRDDLLRAYGSRWREKLHVVSNPVCWARFEEGPDADPPVPGGRYLLSVAAQYPHKNLATLVRAFDLIARRDAYDDVRLVLAGQLSHKLVGIARRPDVRELIAASGLEHRVRVTGYISDRMLGTYYRHAAAFVFPSLFEGFGMPPVEALGFGLPVITTRCTALPESTRGLAHYVDDPLDAHELADALAAVLDDPQGKRPPPAALAGLRSSYAPAAIGAQYYGLLAGSGLSRPASAEYAYAQ
jgi:glycosyltransferase involved in cell wall biosynthesis